MNYVSSDKIETIRCLAWHDEKRAQEENWAIIRSRIGHRFHIYREEFAKAPILYPMLSEQIANDLNNRR